MLTARPGTESQHVFEEAQRYLVGGASAAARIHPSLGRPFMTARGQGGRVYDLDGNSYVDFNTSFGAALLGHGHPAVFRAIQQALEMGVLCAHETEFHAAVARKITELVPCAELVRFTGSGTETTWHAVRVVVKGDTVLIVQEGWGASTSATGKPGAAIDSAIVGVVDYIDLLEDLAK